MNNMNNGQNNENGNVKDYGAFFIKYGAIKEVIIKDGITSINAPFFSYVLDAEKIYIPSSVNAIDPTSFNALSYLKEIEISKDNPYYYTFQNAVYLKQTDELVTFPVCKVSPLIIKKGINIFYSFALNNQITSVILGPEVSDIDYVALNKLLNLQNVFVSQDNKYFCSVDGILYSKDKSTLLFVPPFYNKNVRVLKTVTSIKTLNFRQDNIHSFSLEEGNQTFVENNGVIYSKNLEDDFVWSCKNNNKTLFIPDVCTSSFIYPSSGLPYDPILSNLWRDLKRKEYKRFIESEIEKGNLTRIDESDNRIEDSSNKEKVGNVSQDECTMDENVEALLNAIKDPLDLDYDDVLGGDEEDIKINDTISKNEIDTDFMWGWDIRDSDLDSFKELEYIEVSKDNEKFSSYDGILYSKDMSVLLYCPKGRGGKIIIKNGTKKINTAAFKNCRKITSVVIPHSVTDCGMYAFENCVSLTQAFLSERMKKVPSNMFLNCKNLYCISLPEGIEKICKESFSGCDKISCIKLPSSMKEIDMDCYSNPYMELSIVASPVMDNITKVAGEVNGKITLVGNFGKVMCNFAAKHKIKMQSVGYF